MLDNAKVLDVQLHCSEEVQKEVRSIWADRALCNDYCFIEWDEGYKANCPNLYKFLIEQGMEKDDYILIHYWW